MIIDPLVVALAAMVSTAALAVLAGLIAGILHAVDGATPAAAVRAGGRAALAVASMLLVAVGVAVALWGR